MKRRRAADAEAGGNKDDEPASVSYTNPEQETCQGAEAAAAVCEAVDICLFVRGLLEEHYENNPENSNSELNTPHSDSELKTQENVLPTSSKVGLSDEEAYEFFRSNRRDSLELERQSVLQRLDLNNRELYNTDWLIRHKACETLEAIKLLYDYYTLDRRDNFNPCASPARRKEQEMSLAAVMYDILYKKGIFFKEGLTQFLFLICQTRDDFITLRRSELLPVLMMCLEGFDSGLNTWALKHRKFSKDKNVLKKQACSLANEKKVLVMTSGKKLERIIALTAWLKGIEDGEGAVTDYPYAEEVVTFMTALRQMSGCLPGRCQLAPFKGLQTVMGLYIELVRVYSPADDMRQLCTQACQFLINMVCADAMAKLVVCTSEDCLLSLLKQFESQDHPLVKAVAEVLGCLTMLPETESQEKFREIKAVERLMKVAFGMKEQATLGCILISVNNLTSSCTALKDDFCALDGALRFLIGLFTHPMLKVAELSLKIVGNVSRQIFSHVVCRPILQDTRCLETLTSLLWSPSVYLLDPTCDILLVLACVCQENRNTFKELGVVEALMKLADSEDKPVRLKSRILLKVLNKPVVHQNPPASGDATDHLTSCPPQPELVGITSIQQSPSENSVTAAGDATDLLTSSAPKLKLLGITLYQHNQPESPVRATGDATDCSTSLLNFAGMTSAQQSPSGKFDSPVRTTDRSSSSPPRLKLVDMTSFKPVSPVRATGNATDCSSSSSPWLRLLGITMAQQSPSVKPKSPVRASSLSPPRLKLVGITSTQQSPAVKPDSPVRATGDATDCSSSSSPWLRLVGITSARQSQSLKPAGPVRATGDVTDCLESSPLKLVGITSAQQSTPVKSESSVKASSDADNCLASSLPHLKLVRVADKPITTAKPETTQQDNHSSTSSPEAVKNKAYPGAWTPSAKTDKKFFLMNALSRFLKIFRGLVRRVKAKLKEL